MTLWQRFRDWLTRVLDALWGDAPVEPPPPPPPEDEPDEPVGIRFPEGAIQTRAPSGDGLIGIPWAQVARWEPLFTEAAAREGRGVFAPLLQACFAVVESRANHYESGERTGTRYGVLRGNSDARAIGIMQIRVDLHDPQERYQPYTPEGNIRLGAKLLADWIESEGSWEAALRNKWHPGTDPVSKVTVEEYIRAVREMIYEAKGETPPPVEAEVVFGRVPPPANYQERLIAPNRVNTAYTRVDRRIPRGIVLHRMIGTLAGTDAYFRGEARTRALTDFGLGQGKVYRWTEPGAAIAPWASGASSPAHSVASGDGIAFVNRYGWRQNPDCESIEIEGLTYATPVPPEDYQRLVELVAWRADAWLRVSWQQWPKNRDGAHALFWHNEFTNEKPCPGEVVMGLTPQLIEDVRARLKRYQTA